MLEPCVGASYWRPVLKSRVDVSCLEPHVWNIALMPRAGALSLSLVLVPHLRV